MSVVSSLELQRYGVQKEFPKIAIPSMFLQKDWAARAELAYL